MFHAVGCGPRQDRLRAADADFFVGDLDLVHDQPGIGLTQLRRPAVELVSRRMAIRLTLSGVICGPADDILALLQFAGTLDRPVVVTLPATARSPRRWPIAKMASLFRSGPNIGEADGGGAELSLR
jgi:hypothetical protein